jgi:hypothetical protein
VLGPCLLVANYPYFLEIDAERGQIFRDIADVLVLGAAGQDLAADYQERGRDNLFGSGELGVDMITCESAQKLEFGRLIKWGAAPFQTQHQRRRENAQGPGGMEENS